MTRSSKKDPYVEERLMERILRMNENNEKRMLKTWSRASVIYPEMVGHTIGEFASTRTFRTHVKGDRTARRR
jgi:small subunit ribosomal protein S19